jgi:nucleoside phosphorylase
LLDDKRRELAFDPQESEAREQRIVRLSKQLEGVPGPLDVLRSLPRTAFGSQAKRQDWKPDVLLVTVNEHETRAVLDAFLAATGEEAKPVTLQGRLYHDLGDVNGTTVYHAISEMGSGGSGGMQQTVEKAISALDPGAVIAVGMAFGVNEEKQNIGEIIVSRLLRLYELQRVGKKQIVLRGARPDASPRLMSHFRGFSQARWRGARVRFGVMLTGEKLVDNVDYRSRLLKFESEAEGGEMEGAGLYVSSYDNRVDWIVIKAICDWADGNKDVDKEARQKLAAKNAAEFVVESLQYASLKRA